ncbi:MAG: acyl-CoA thioesterase [Opitutus sp.]|nr:acyl-CoA thioesterase [Opitutus sp.]
MNSDKVLPDRFHFKHRRAVEFADTDMAGIMHFANFLRFVECAEHAFFRSLGFHGHTADGAEHQGWPRLEVSCTYREPARFEQTLETCLRIEEIRTSSLRYGFWIFAAEAPTRPLLAHGSFSIIHVELGSSARVMRKAPIPPALRVKLAAAMAGAV